MNPAHLLQQADFLAKRSKKKPKQADLRRAISACYYAVFHALCKSNADALAGTGSSAPTKAWTQVYRSIDHAQAKKRCKTVASKGFPIDLSNFADAFVSLQELRHSADYDPTFSVRRSEVMNHVALAQNAVAAIGSSALKMSDRKAFAAHVLLNYRE